MRKTQNLIALALDVGERRIGLALSDPSGLLATPLATIQRTQEPADVDEVLRLAEEHDVEKMVVGLPLELSGRRGPQAGRVMAFARALTGRTELPVETVDERYSTVEAERRLRDSGVEPSKDRARLDAAAAAVILESYLDARREPRL